MQISKSCPKQSKDLQIEQDKNQYNQPHQINLQTSTHNSLQQDNSTRPTKKQQNDDYLLVIIISCIGLLTTFFVIGFVVTYQHFNTKKDITTIILVVNGTQAQTLKSIHSFTSKNKQVRQFIVGVRTNNKTIIQNLTAKTHIIQTPTQSFQLSFLQKLIAQVKTQYIFLTTTQWQLENQNFLIYSKNMMSQFPQISQILPNQMEKLYQGYLLLDNVGFSFAPGLHRKQYFQQLLQNIKFTQGSKRIIINQQTQKKASQIMLKKGLQAILVHRFGIKKLRQQYGNKKYIKNNPLKEQVKTYYQGQLQIKLEKIEDYVTKILYQRRQGSKIFQIQKIKLSLPQLPFCILVTPSSKYSFNSITKSIYNQNYSNIRILTPQPNVKQLNYYYYFNLLNNKCIQNSVIMFIDSPLKPNALKYLNKAHQQNLAWITYAQTNTTVEVFSFYIRIYQLLLKNDFNKSNQIFLFNQNITIQTIGLLQICSVSNKKVQKQDILSMEDKSYFYIQKKDNLLCKRTPYTKIHRLSQDMQIRVQPFLWLKYDLPDRYSSGRTGLTKQNLMRASDRQQQWYLPQNHTIKYLQRLDYNNKFKINNYQSIQKQVPFCVTVLSHNNIQNDRYIKVIKSIVKQQYKNYHIVFIDDNSTDENLQATIDYFKKIKFPNERVTFIKNLQRNYATYNIINSAFNYCKEDDIQMLIDGDDQFIGKYAFQVMNSAYQQQPNLWAVYSNYKTNYYEYGRSTGFTSENEHALNNRRLYISSIGPIRTWRVKLLYNIPMAHHKMPNGRWLDTVYDDAIQHPILQLATVKRVKYINQILYEYNVKYGDNDDSTPYKIKHRTVIYQYILGIHMLEPLETLNGTIKDKDIQKQLLDDKDIKYSCLSKK